MVEELTDVTHKLLVRVEQSALEPAATADSGLPITRVARFPKSAGLYHLMRSERQQSPLKIRETAEDEDQARAEMESDARSHCSSNSRHCFY